MLSRKVLLTFLLACWVLFPACQREDDPLAPPPDPGLVDLPTALAHQNTSYVRWIEKVRGRVGRNSNGSFVVWSRRNDYQLGLVVSAAHVLGIGWFGEENSDIPAQFWLPEGREGVLRLNLPPADGSVMLEEVSPLYDLFNPAIPASENKDFLTGILPAHDFFVGLIDSQIFPVTDGPVPIPKPLQKDTPLVMYDPEQLTLQEPTWQEGLPFDSVMLLGYPQDKEQFPHGAVSLGSILADTAARTVIERLKAIGDEEGLIAYEPSVEMIITAEAIAGMSGGGVFNQEGHLLGIMVRATDALEKGYIRAVRMSYVVAQVRQAWEASPADREKLAPYLNEEISNHGEVDP